MELFTLGVGNYTEDDVDAVGPRVDRPQLRLDTGQYLFRADRHDTGNKTFFGTTTNWDGPDIIDEILVNNAGQAADRRPVHRQEAVGVLRPSRARRASSTSSPTCFIANNLEIKPLMRAIAAAATEFYSTTAKQGLVRTPDSSGSSPSRSTRA